MHARARNTIAALCLTALGAACSSSTTGSSATVGGTGTPTTRAATTSSTDTGGASSTAASTATSGGTTSTSRPASSSAASSAASTSAPSVVDALADGDLTAFVGALQASGVLKEIEGRSVTILAPGNAAFAALGADGLKALLADPARAKAVLENHVIDGAWPAARLAGQTSVKALSGRSLTVADQGGTLSVDGARVVKADTSDRRVVVHVIDRVLTTTT